MTRMVLVFTICMMSVSALAGDVLASGNSFNDADATFSGNLARLGHTFQFISQQDVGTTSLDGFSAVWLDGFSDFSGLSTQTLTSFVESGGVILVQAPGFGSQSRSSWPLGDSFGNSFTTPDFENTIRIQVPNHPIMQGVTDTSLSNWEVSAVGLMDITGSAFTGLADNGTDGNWVIIYQALGAGHLIYTNQPFGTRLQAAEFEADEDVLRILDNIFSLNEAIEVRPPQFLTRQHFRILENGDLEGVFPDVNADGIDPDGSAGLSYEWSLEKDGTTVVGPIAVADSYPAVATIGADQLPAHPYFIEIARIAEGQRASVKVLAPEGGLSDPAVLRNYRRWLIHTPRRVGGFEGRVRFTNHHPSEAATVLCVGFAGDGERLDAEVVAVPAGTEVTRILYVDDGNGLFGDPEVLDLVSHIAIWEDRQTTSVALQYVSLSSGFGVWTNEYDFDRDAVVGSRFRLSGGAPNAGFWDGLAITNLTSGVSAEITVRRFDGDGNAMGEASLDTLLPGAKQLSVLNFEFPDFLAEATFEIEASGPTGAEKIQVLGLSGLLSGEFFGPARTLRLD